MIKRLASYLPAPVQQKCRKFKYSLDLRRSTFRSQEPEYAILPHIVTHGDWALDIGANVGYYTTLLSNLVGQSGRVFAFEPVPQTFDILAYVLQASGCFRNVTLFNMAVGDHSGIVHFNVPLSKPGLPNYFRAHLEESGAHATYCTSIDQLAFPHRIAFVKIDTEGAEAQVLRGMRNLLERDRPIILAERSEGLSQFLAKEMGYEQHPATVLDSPNLLLAPSKVGCAAKLSAAV